LQTPLILPCTLQKIPLRIKFREYNNSPRFEKDIIRERVIAGLVNTRSRGKRLGRPPIPRPTFEKAKEMYSQKISFREIGRTLGIDEGTIRKRFKKK
jgi:DNA invertase Pin-like site-specific DNA recombinase